jgi:hypothetical protein
LTCGTLPGIARIGVWTAGAGVALGDSSTGGGDFFAEAEGSGDGVSFGDEDFSGDGDLLNFFFLDLVSAFRFDGLGEVLAFFFFEGVGVASSSDLVFFFFAVGVSLGFGVAFFFGEDFGLGEGDFS